MTKKCDICGAEFAPSKGHELRQRYCSKACRYVAGLESRKKRAAEQSSVGKLTACKICGREYIKEYSRHVYCSDACKVIGLQRNRKRAIEKASILHSGRDRSRIRRGSKEYTRECVVCGEVFTTWYPQKKTCSDACKEIHKKERNIGRDRKSKRSRKHTTEEYHAQWIRRRYGSDESYQEHLREMDRKKQKQRMMREAEKEARKTRGECTVCGKPYETFNPKQKTCSTACSKKLSYARKQNRIPKDQIIDKDITLEALYRWNSGICYLCGKQCDWSDKDGNIVGPNYPSIDHLVPVARGGLHAWNNVRLAHFKCNVDKSDTIIPSVKKMIPSNAYQFKRETRERKKRTAQYALNGDLVTVFSSTATAEKTTGVKQRGIQKCARGESKSYGGFIWRYV